MSWAVVAEVRFHRQHSWSLFGTRSLATPLPVPVAVVVVAAAAGRWCTRLSAIWLFCAVVVVVMAVTVVAGADVRQGCNAAVWCRAVGMWMYNPV